MVLFIETGDKRAVPYPLSVLGRIARDEGDFEASFAAFRRALQICYEINYLPKSLDILFELATVLEAMSQPAQAVRLLAFVTRHPKINHETRKAGEKLMDELSGLLSPKTAEEIRQKGKEDTIESIMRAVFNRELEQKD
jgi:tetratricopeptide (TPR) repeat protein